MVTFGSHNFTISTPGISATVTPPGTGSLIFGGQAGYNWEMGRFVAGVEGDLAAQNIGTAEWCTVSTVSNWLATARLRAGVNVTEIPYLQWVYFYGTGGAAFANAINQGVLGGVFVDQTETKVGWTVGGGFELPLSPRWTAKFEYLFADLGNINLAQGGSSYNTRFTEQVMRSGVNFRF
jgi:outer membrane immunogenic protein